MHKNRPVCFYLVVKRDIFYIHLRRMSASVFPAKACAGDAALVPTSQVARAKRASGRDQARLLKLLFGSLSLPKSNAPRG